MSVALNFLVEVLHETFGLPRMNLHPDATFAELDMDSLTLTELSTIIEERTGLRMDRFPVTCNLTEAADLLDRAADAFVEAREARESA
ncbi:acyl carrier protein [Streptomyces sp. JJ38]|uniref:acyl carrier protein n=1 Tax=Streptomyces sp. JJ38 TaxID=2738128 RepID=UPI001C55C74C|nr:acyl carrier protein [Streptomyces sp. JJ38]MBW1598043.1 acyl carrier protein [Streptomyces sp. JJ38]